MQYELYGRLKENKTLAGKINCKILTCQNFEMPNSKVWLTDCNFNIVSKTNLHTAFCNNFLGFFLIAYFLFLKKYIYLCFSGVICMYFIISAILLVANKLLLAIFQIICLFFMTQTVASKPLVCSVLVTLYVASRTFTFSADWNSFWILLYWKVILKKQTNIFLRVLLG